MSGFAVHLGPYAEWVLPPRVYERIFHLDPYWGEDPFWQRICDDRLLAAWSPPWPPEVKVRGKVRRRFCFIEAAFLPAGPLRQLRQALRSQSRAFGVADLREIDAQAEVDRFTAANAADLASIAERVGRPATLGWGVVAWDPA
jgi:hypothetical protein